MVTAFKIAAAIAFLSCASAASLPSFVTPCNRNDPNIIDCATKEGIKVLPDILKGVKSLKIPKLAPLNLPEVRIDVGNNLNIKLTDIVIYGIEDNTLHKVDVDLKKLNINVKIGFPRLNLQSQYDINGRILVLPIRGQGPANITFVGAEFDFYADAEFYTKGGKEYVKLTNPKLTYTTKRAHFYLENLFDGDKRLGDEMNKFLDENWADILKDLGPAISNVISSIALQIASSFFGKIPYDELLVE